MIQINFLDYPGKCWVERSNKAYSVGEIWSDGSSVCGQYKCEDEGSLVVYTDCGHPKTAPPGYKEEGDLSKPYPDCCPKRVKI